MLTVSLKLVVPAYASAEKHRVLVAAAMQLFHEQGLQRTTLAHVADRAKVPLGNVYYYFKTKEALAEVVINEHARTLREHFGALTSGYRDPRMRLRLFIRSPLAAADQVVRFGCSHGTLCQEVEKLGPGSLLAKSATRLLAVYLEWTEEQFRAMGVDRREARDLAADLVGATKGALLLANTMHSKELLIRQIRRIEAWLDAIHPQERPKARRTVRARASQAS
jgi:TetR/AcrR family transcriptional regulator, transcriptional repressor for nem operon